MDCTYPCFGEGVKGGGALTLVYWMLTLANIFEIYERFIYPEEVHDNQNAAAY